MAFNFYDFLNEIAIACFESAVVQLQALRDIVRASTCHDVSFFFSKKESVPELGVAFMVVSHRRSSTKMNETHIQRSFWYSIIITTQLSPCFFNQRNPNDGFVILSFRSPKPRFICIMWYWQLIINHNFLPCSIHAQFDDITSWFINFFGHKQAP